LQAPVVVLPAAQRALLAGRSLWNLRQFDLAARHRGLRVLTDALHRIMSPEWRPVRAGLVALGVLQIIGLNLWAWQLRGAMADKQRAMIAMLRAAHPQV